MADTKISALTDLGAAPASGDLFVVVDVSDTTMGASGTTKKVAASNLIPERVWVPAQQWTATVGSPVLLITLASAKSVPVWLFDAAAGSENVTAAVALPSTWAQVAVDLYWTEPSGGTGDVVWRMDRAEYGDGLTTDTETTGSNVTVTAPAQYVLKVSTLLSGITVTPSTKPLLRLEILRLGSNVGDTLANDAAVLGVMIRKTA